MRGIKDHKNFVPEINLIFMNVRLKIVEVLCEIGMGKNKKKHTLCGLCNWVAFYYNWSQNTVKLRHIIKR